MLHSVYGLNVEANVHIPGLARLSVEQSPDVWVWLGRMPSWLDETPYDVHRMCYVSAIRDECGQPSWTVEEFTGGEHLRVSFCDGTVFLMSRDGTRIWGTWPDSLTLEDTAVYLLGPIIGLALRLKGIACLHASAVVIGDRAVALLGPAGAGKSTTAAAFARMGFPVLSEDVVALTESEHAVAAQPGYAHVRLWPAAVEILYQVRDALPPLTRNWDKRGLDLTANGYHFHPHAQPLAAIYLLNDRRSTTEAPMVEPMPARDALMTLVANTYVNYWLEPAMRAAEFEVLTRLVARVPIRTVTPHADPAHLSRLCDVILEDFQSISD